jgi:hypothetical protein
MDDLANNRCARLTCGSNKIFETGEPALRQGLGLAEITTWSMLDFCRRRFPDRAERLGRYLAEHPDSLYLDFEATLTAIANAFKDIIFSDTPALGTMEIAARVPGSHPAARETRVSPSVRAGGGVRASERCAERERPERLWRPFAQPLADHACGFRGHHGAHSAGGRGSDGPELSTDAGRKPWLRHEESADHADCAAAAEIRGADCGRILLRPVARGPGKSRHARDGSGGGWLGGGLLC